MQANARKSSIAKRNSSTRGPRAAARHATHLMDSDTKRRFTDRVKNDLSKDEQVLLVLHYHERLAQPEIALVMDLPIAAVRRLHQGILTRLRNGITDGIASPAFE